MSRRDQPYLPLYVQDVLTDEKLIECSASAHGVYFRLLCILHKQETYGRILLKQKYKQMSEFCSGKSETNCEQNKDKDKANFFAKMLAKQMPFGEQVIFDALIELLEEGVITIDGDMLFQKRMVRDFDLSEKRSDFGKKGGNKATKQYGKPGILYLMSDGEKLNKIGASANPINRLYRLRSNLKLPKHFEIRDQVEVADMGEAEDMCLQIFSDMMDGGWVSGPFDLIASKFASLKSKIQLKHKQFAQAFAQANVRANAENEIEIENENNKGGVGEKENPTIEQGPLGSEVVQEAARKSYANAIWVENVCMANNLTKDDLKKWMAKYNSSICNDRIANFDDSTYRKLFTGWLSSQFSKGYSLPKEIQPEKKETIKYLNS